MWNKFKAIKSGKYHSKKEHRRALDLELLQKSNAIVNLKEQVRFELLPSFKDSSGNTERGIAYIADFVYFDKQAKRWTVEDCKGFKTKDYIIKRKLFKHSYPEFLFLET